MREEVPVKNNATQQISATRIRGGTRTLLVGALVLVLLALGIGQMFWKEALRHQANAHRQELEWQKKLGQTFARQPNSLRAVAGTAYKQLPRSPVPSYFLALAEFNAGNELAALSYLEAAEKLAPNEQQKGIFRETSTRIRRADPRPFIEMTSPFVE